MHSSRNRRFFLALAATGALNLSARAEAPEGPKEGLGETWSSFWDDCYDLNLPYFQSRIKKFISMLHSGDGWEKAMEVEKLEIDKLNNETCAKWGKSHNGDESLREFVAQLSKVANGAIALKGQIVTEIGPQMEAWTEVEDKELAPYGFKLAEFPCGRAFKRTTEDIQERLAVLEEKVLSIQEACLKTGDKAVADAIAAGLTPLTKTYGQGSGKVVRKPAKNGKSDITGVEKAKRQAAEGEEILKKQEAEAAEQNARKEKQKQEQKK